jgi:arylsulfatase A-like enzyme
MPRAKCTLYDPGIEVALIVRWPEGGISGGMVFSELISNIDLLPTLIEAAGGAPDPRMQGRSFLPLLANQGYAARERVFAEKTYHSYYDPMRCIRTPRHKYIRNFETGFAVDVPGDAQQGAIFRSDPSRYSTDRSAIVEFYDLERDPAEEQNLAGRKELKTVEGELDRELWRWMEETGDPLLKGPIASPRYRLALANRR